MPRRAAGAGFNTFHPTIDNRADVADLLDAAAAYGVYVLPEVPLPANGPGHLIANWYARWEGAQLVTSDGGSCWQGTYAAGPGTRSSAQLFRAKSG